MATLVVKPKIALKSKNVTHKHVLHGVNGLSLTSVVFLVEKVFQNEQGCVWVEPLV